jgi:hypothetical protein
MRCPDCKRPMTVLFTSCACDWCDGLVPIVWQHGFVVFRGDDDFARPVQVFPSQGDAAVYRSKNGWHEYPIREVLFELRVRWKRATHALAGVTIAARPFTLHRDHRFEPLPFHCYLVPVPSRQFAA